MRKEYLSRAKTLAIECLAVAFFCSVTATAARAYPTSDKEQVRAVLVNVFSQLKQRQYSELYDQLSVDAQRKLTRERFVRTLQNTQSFYKLDRMDIGTITVKGNQATASTVMYGHVLQPREQDGKLVVQHSLIRLAQGWRWANTSAPRVYIRQDGKWLDVTALMKAARR